MSAHETYCICCFNTQLRALNTAELAVSEHAARLFLREVIESRMESEGCVSTPRKHCYAQLGEAMVSECVNRSPEAPERKYLEEDIHAG